MGGFASQFDLISSEYGWTDEQIGELPFMRFQQIVSAISIRKTNEARQESSRFSWLARAVSTFVAAGYMVEGENAAVKDAQSIAFDPVERALLAHAASKPAEPVVREPAPGSFERLMGFMGQTRD